MKTQQLINNLMSHINDDPKLFNLRASYEAEQAEIRDISEYSATEQELRKLLLSNCFSLITGRLLPEYSEYNY